MKSSKLIKALSTFTNKEFKEFEKRANSAFYKSEKHLIFIKLISNNFPNFEESKIEKKKIFSQIYKKEAYADIRIRELMSALNKVLREYFVYLQISSNKFEYELDLLKQYNSRKLGSLYESQLKLVHSILKKDKFENKEYYRRAFLLASVENDHFRHKHIRTLDVSLQEAMNNLDYFYFSTKLIETCQMINRQKLLSHSYDLNLFTEIEVIINENKEGYLNHPIIVCYYDILKLLKTDNDINQLNSTLKTLKKHTSLFTNNELKALFDFPQNYCIGNLNKGDDSYLEKLFELQMYIINKEFNYIDGFISNISYDNIIAVGLKLKKYDWVKNFIENYKEKITPISRENSYNMNKANLNYALEFYDETIFILNQVEFNDFYYAYYSKVLLLKTYYAKGEFETLSYFITSFKLYLKRNKQATITFKKGADLFLNNFKKIFSIKEKLDFLDAKKTNLKLEAIKASIKEEKNIHNRVWLLEIIKKIEK